MHRDIACMSHIHFCNLEVCRQSLLQCILTVSNIFLPPRYLHLPKINNNRTAFENGDIAPHTFADLCALDSRSSIYLASGNRRTSSIPRRIKEDKASCSIMRTSTETFNKIIHGLFLKSTSANELTLNWNGDLVGRQPAFEVCIQ